MHTTIVNLEKITNEINERLQNNNAKKKPNVIAVSKTFGMDKIEPLINYGHIHFGENKVQEAVEKWTDLKKINGNIKLHMIGKLQSNKVKQVVPLFDYLHSLDNYKLAKKIHDEETKNDKKIKIFIQINLGLEEQKSGINSKDLKDFYLQCINDLKLDIIGLMCLPPNDADTENYFSEMRKLVLNNNFEHLSMGMSNDYLSAAKNSATYVRIGSKIFGARD